MPKFEPEYHEGNGGAFYALPQKRSGVSRLSAKKYGERCWVVYREALCTDLVFDTYEEANERASELAFNEVAALAKMVKEGFQPKSTNIYGHLPGRIEGEIEEGEAA